MGRLVVHPSISNLKLVKLVFQSRSDSRDSVVPPSVRLFVRSSVRLFVMPFQLYHHSTFSSINFLTNQLYSSLAQLQESTKSQTLLRGYLKRSILHPPPNSRVSIVSSFVLWFVHPFVRPSVMLDPKSHQE